RVTQRFRRVDFGRDGGGRESLKDLPFCARRIPRADREVLRANAQEDPFARGPLERTCELIRHRDLEFSRVQGASVLQITWDEVDRRATDETRDEFVRGSIINRPRTVVLLQDRKGVGWGKCV